MLVLGRARRRLLVAAGALPLVALALALPGGRAHGAAAAPAADVCARAAAAGPTSLAATLDRVGIVDLHMIHATGVEVTFYECVGARPQRLGTGNDATAEMTSLYAATTWRCSRLTRRFAAAATLADGTAASATVSVRTRSCADRFAVSAPGVLVRGRRAELRISDRWRVGGVRSRLCVTAPRASTRCRTLVFAGRAGTLVRRVRMATRGHWRIELRGAGHRIRTTVAVGVRRRAARRPPPPTVLATGDSTMQGIDSFLGDALGTRARLVSDVRPGAAISRGESWAPIAAAQATRVRPRDTVVSIGANEGGQISVAGSVIECCTADWIAAYGARLGEIAGRYLRGGRSRLLWLTIPAPRDPRRAPIFAAVNQAILGALEGRAGVRVLRMDLLFSPAGFRDVMTDGGRDVRVRARDGIHLSVAGTRIAAREIARALRAR